MSFGTMIATRCPSRGEWTYFGDSRHFPCAASGAYISGMTEEKQPDQAQSATPATETATGNTKDAATGKNKALWAGAAVGIGSAAIVAALLYANKRRK